jgi:HAD superfamily hydrolase (TIGR01662 family)
MTRITTVIFDLGETLVDETRQWQIVAEATGVPCFTLAAVLGSALERGLDHGAVWAELGIDHVSAVDHGYTVTPDLFYPDALPALRTLKDAGYRVGIVANQPAGVAEQLEALGLPLDIVATSASIGVAKPDPRFFEHIVAVCGVPAGEIAYVGDRLDNDVLPAQSIDMAAVFIRRGPWGYIQARTIGADRARYRIESLAELPALLASIDDTQPHLTGASLTNE